MSVSTKLAISIIGVIAVIVTVFTVIVKTQITPDRVRKTLLPLVEDSLQRKVDFGKINIGIFSGITVAKLKVASKSDVNELFSVDNIELHYQLWPLLTGKVVIDQILLNRPKIHITRLPSGVLNFNDLLPQIDESKEYQHSGQQYKATELNSSFDLFVKEINIVDGELLYVDKFINAKNPYRYTLKKLNIKARQIAFDKSFPIELSAIINDANIDISGNYDLSKRVGSLSLQLEPLDLVRFAPYYRKKFPGKLSSGRLALNLDIDVNADSVSSTGKIETDNLDLVLAQYPDAHIKKAKLGIDYALSFNLRKSLLRVSTLLLDFNGINLGAEGEFDLSSDDQFMVFSLIFDKFDLRDVMQNLPLELSREYKKYSFAGMIDGRVELAGKIDSGVDLFKSANLNLMDVRASAENLRAGINGDISYAGKVLQTDNLQLQYGDQQLQLQLLAKNENGKYNGNFKLSAPLLDINKLIPTESNSGKVIVSNDSTISTEHTNPVEHRNSEIGPFDFPVKMAGTIVVGRVVYKELNIDNLNANLILQDNYLTISNLFGKIGNGNLSASAQVDLGVSGLAYKGKLALKQPTIAILVDGLMPRAKQSSSGALQFNSSFSGQGTGSSLMNKLIFKGDFTVLNGEVTGSPLLADFSSFLGNQDLRVLKFNSFAGKYYLNAGVVKINSSIDSSKMKLAPSGTITVSGEMDLKLDAKFAPATMSKLKIDKKIMRALVDSSGWGQLPLQIKGNLDAPEFGFDTVAMQHIATDKVTTELSERIMEEIAPEAIGDAEPMKQLLDETLNKLFGN